MLIDISDLGCYRECMICGEPRPPSEVYNVTDTKYVCAMGRGCMENITKLPFEVPRDYVDKIIIQDLQHI